MKKGFTLIELLAVIVILAIIALIATPIVLNIINDARESSTLRSADFYLDAVEYTIADAVLHNDGIIDKTYHIDKNGNLCKVNLNDDKECPSTEDTLVVEVNGEKPSSGSITIENGNIKDISIDLNDRTIIINKDGELDYIDTSLASTLATLCTLQDGYTSNTIGAKYSCDFGAGARNFYILELGTNPVRNSTLKENEVALILEVNYDDETLPWCDQSGPNPDNTQCNADGLTSKLDEIAGVWVKLKRSQIVLPSVAQIVIADGQSEDEFEDLTNSWLYSNNTDSVGYWTSTSNSNSVYIVDTGAHVASFNVYGGALFSDEYLIVVRPVINLKIK